MFGNFFAAESGAFLIGLFGALYPIFGLFCNYAFMRTCRKSAQQLLFSRCTLLLTAGVTAALFFAAGHLPR